MTVAEFAEALRVRLPGRSSAQVRSAGQATFASGQLRATRAGPGLRHTDRTPGMADLPHAQCRQALAPGRPGRSQARHDTAADGDDDHRGRRGTDRRRHDGTILDRTGKAYKPSTARRYEQLLRAYVIPVLGGWKLSELQRRDVQDFVDGLRRQGLSPSTIANILDPLRVIFRRAIRRDEVAIDPTENLDLPAIRARRDRIEPPEVAHELLAALPDSERAFWAGRPLLRPAPWRPPRLQWTNVDFDNGVIRVERSWDPVKGPVDVKTGADRRAVPMAFVVRRELKAHQQRTNHDGADLAFGRTATEAFFASTTRARANKAWGAAGLAPITPHEARHCAISYFIAAGLDWKQISTWAGHGDVARPGTATGTSFRAAKRPPASALTRT